MARPLNLDHAQVAQYYCQIHSMKETAAVFGCSEHTVLFILKKAGIAREGKSRGSHRRLPKGRPKARTVEQRFYCKVVKADGSDGCWLWIGGGDEDGYGRFSLDGRGVRTHRLAWEFENGPIPKGMQVLHRCDERYDIGDTTYRRCVRVGHLFLGTHKDNVKDKVAKGRHMCRRNSRYLGPQELQILASSVNLSAEELTERIDDIKRSILLKRLRALS